VWPSFKECSKREQRACSRRTCSLCCSWHVPPLLPQVSVWRSANDVRRLFLICTTISRACPALRKCNLLSLARQCELILQSMAKWEASSMFVQLKCLRSSFICAGYMRSPSLNCLDSLNMLHWLESSKQSAQCCNSCY
jgi:hypothetical protein